LHQLVELRSVAQGQADRQIQVGRCSDRAYEPRFRDGLGNMVAQ
jgi:hypothetical protein